MEKAAEIQSTEKQPIKDESSSEEEVMDKDQQVMWERIEKVLEEYYLSPFQILACKKFIKDKIGNPNDTTVDRARKWLFMKVNG